MKTRVDIITGFIGSGKTTFIKNLLASNSLMREKIVVLQYEIGEKEIRNELSDNIIVIDGLSKENSMNHLFIAEIIETYTPDRIVIEFNGMSKFKDLLTILEHRLLRSTVHINNKINIIDPSTFDIFINNMASILIEQISNSDILIINDYHSISKDEVDRIKARLKVINKDAYIIWSTSKENIDLYILNKQTKGIPTIFSNATNIFFIGATILLILIMLLLLFKGGGFSLLQLNLPYFQEFSTIFLSILIQAFPFILFGTFISAVLQVFISEELIEKNFPQHGFEGFIFAITAGMIFPVCDCAIVPIVGRLIKKGVSVPVAVTFMLAVPIVNPIVIASTFYAFPDQHFVALYRVVIGVVVAIAVGITFKFVSVKESILKEGIESFDCNCGYCDDTNRNAKGFPSKINAIIKHAGTEFFQVGQYLILGAFLSTIIRTIIPKVSFVSLGGVDIASLIVMMLAAFILSVCSTSDAFIARSFINQFSLASIMGFLVLGPMIDIKNLLMLLGNFKKKFVITLVSIIFIVSFIIIYSLTSILF